MTPVQPTSGGFSIVCSDASHSRRKAAVLVVQWIQLYPGEPRRWMIQRVMQSDRLAHGHAAFRREVDAETEAMAQALDDESLPDSREAERKVEARWNAQGRSTKRVVAHNRTGDSVYYLRCPLCGLDLQRKADVIQRAMDALVDAGFLEVELRTLLQSLT